MQTIAAVSLALMKAIVWCVPEMDGKRAMRSMWMAAVALGMAALGPKPADAGKYTIRFIDFPGARSTFPTGLNDNDKVVGFFPDSKTGLSHGFVLFHGRYRQYDLPGAVSTRLSAINDRGVVVGTYDNANFVGTMFTHNLVSGNSVDIPFTARSNLQIFPTAINDAGVIVGGVEAGYLDFAFEARGGSARVLGQPKGGNARYQAVGINASGLVIGTCQYCGSFTFRGGITKAFTVSGALSTTLNFVTNSGTLGGHWSNLLNGAQIQFGFTQSAGGAVTNFQYPGSTSTSVDGLTRAGDIVGDYSHGRNSDVFVYSGGRYYPIPIPIAAAHAVSIKAVNARGSFLGEGFFGFDSTVYFIGYCPADQVPCTQ